MEKIREKWEYYKEKYENVILILFAILLLILPAGIMAFAFAHDTPVTEDEAISFVAHYEKMLHTGSDSYTIVFSDHEALVTSNYAVRDYLLESGPGTELAVKLHPKAGYIMSLQSGDRVFIDFNETLARRASAIKGFIVFESVIYGFYLLLGIYCAVGRLKLKESKEEKKKSIDLPIDEIIDACTKLLDVDFVIETNEGHFHVGTSACTDPDHTMVFDRKYYVRFRKCTTIEEFTSMLNELSGNSRLRVVEIDELPVSCYDSVEEYLTKVKVAEESAVSHTLSYVDIVEKGRKVINRTKGKHLHDNYEKEQMKREKDLLKKQRAKEKEIERRYKKVDKKH